MASSPKDTHEIELEDINNTNTTFDNLPSVDFDSAISEDIYEEIELENKEIKFYPNSIEFYQLIIELSSINEILKLRLVCKLFHDLSEITQQINRKADKNTLLKRLTWHINTNVLPAIVFYLCKDKKKFPNNFGSLGRPSEQYFMSEIIKDVNSNDLKSLHKHFNSKYAAYDYYSIFKIAFQTDDVYKKIGPAHDRNLLSLFDKGLFRAREYYNLLAYLHLEMVYGKNRHDAQLEKNIFKTSIFVFWCMLQEKNGKQLQQRLYDFTCNTTDFAKFTTSLYKESKYGLFSTSVQPDTSKKSPSAYFKSLVMSALDFTNEDIFDDITDRFTKQLLAGNSKKNKKDDWNTWQVKITDLIKELLTVHPSCEDQPVFRP